MSTVKLPDQTYHFLSTLHNAGFEAFAVGGCVRDLLMERETHDWDFTTNATPEQIQQLFPDSFYNNQFGTVGVPVTVNDHEEIYEITTYRSEGNYTDNRRPDSVTWGTSLDEDLDRRDFTINAIAYDGTNFSDPHNGKKDITGKLIRAVGNPHKRFSEDALRLLRAVRFATQLNFSIEDETAAAIKTLAPSIKNIAQERIRDELLKIVASNHAADGIMLLKELNLLYEILPEFEKAFATEQKSPERHHEYDVGTHLVESLRHSQSDDVITRFATLLHDIGKPDTYEETDAGIKTFYNHEVVGASMARDIAHRLRLSKKDAGKLIKLVRWHQFSVDEHQTDKAYRRFIRRVGLDYINNMLDLRHADRLGGGVQETSWRTELFKKRIEDVQKQPFSIRDLKIDGNDVMKELNMKPGPEVGKILAELFEEVVEKKVENEKEALITSIKSR